MDTSPWSGIKDQISNIIIEQTPQASSKHHDFVKAKSTLKIIIVNHMS